MGHSNKRCVWKCLQRSVYLPDLQVSPLQTRLVPRYLFQQQVETQSFGSVRQKVSGVMKTLLGCSRYCPGSSGACTRGTKESSKLAEA